MTQGPLNTVDPFTPKAEFDPGGRRKIRFNRA